tara:strand:- start:1455 stop:1772 length:318 start_codon:yes stop_codon:yes gene_type:complete
MALTALSGIFPNITAGDINAGDITIPNGDITSFTPTNHDTSGAAEFVFGMCETMHQAVSTGGLTNCTTSVGTQLVGDTTLKKTYTFVVNLDFTNASLENLDVKPG